MANRLALTMVAMLVCCGCRSSRHTERNVASIEKMQRQEREESNATIAMHECTIDTTLWEWEDTATNTHYRHTSVKIVNNTNSNNYNTMKENTEENSEKSVQIAENISKRETFWTWILVFSAIITIFISRFYKVFLQK